MDFGWESSKDVGGTTHEASGVYASSAIIIPIINTLKVALSTHEDDSGVTRNVMSLEDSRTESFLCYTNSYWSYKFSPMMEMLHMSVNKF